MDRRVLGGGAIVCSTMVLWAQPSPPGFAGFNRNASSDCETGATNATLCPAVDRNSTDHSRQTQEGYSYKSIAPMLSNALRTLPSSIQWSNVQSSRLPDSMEDVYGRLLERAQAAADSDRLTDAVAIIAGIPKNSQYSDKAQQLQADWSQQLLQRATDRCQQGDVGTAISMLDAIPSTSQQQARAAELRERWSQQAAQFGRAIAAKDAGNWQDVISALQSLEGTLMYHSLPVQNLLQQAISQQFQPDAALMQMASATPIVRATVQVPQSVSMPIDVSEQAMPVTAMSVTAMSVAPMPSPLEIDLSQAIAWAQPSMPLVASASTPYPTERAAPTSSRQPLATPPAQPPIAPPEAVSISAKASSEPPKIVPLGNSIPLPETAPLLTAEPTSMPAI